MKAKEAREIIGGYAGNDLFQEACKLFQQEIDSVVELRAHGKTPSRGIVESAVKQVAEWFRTVAEGLQWSEPDLPERIISWETGKVWVKFKMIDPVVDDYRKRARLEMLKGTRFPLFAALNKERLDALSSMSLARMQESAKRYLELEDKRRKFAEQLGKQVCPYNTEERLCKHQETYLMTSHIFSVSAADDLVFVCTAKKCIKEKES